MSIINASPLLGAGTDGYQIERSLRFNSADSTYLNRTFGTPTNNIKWTWSGWVKRSTLGSYQNLFCGDDGTSNNFLNFRISDNNDRIDCFQVSGGSYNLQLVTDARFRDPSAWYHVVLIYDSANATSTDRVQIYVNGTRQTVSYPVGPFAQNTACQANVSSRSHAIGRVLFTSGNYLDGYLTEIHFIDGQALTPSSFGETDTITGVWKPKAFSGTYGTNGFKLTFSDNSGTTSTTLGKDSSGNGNNWTPNNFSVTAGAGNDSMIDVPTPYADGGNGRGNYCTLNPLILIPRGTISNGNLNYLSGSTASHGSAAASFTLPTTGKWYWEVTACANSGGSGNNESIGVANIQNNPQLPASGSEVGSRSGDYAYRSNAARVSGGSSVSYGATYTNGDVIGVAWDSDAGTLVFYKNGSSQGTAYSSITQEAGKYAPASSNAESSNGDTFNFGQRSFSYTVPAGFSALNTQNLPEPSIKKPSSYFSTVLYTGNGTSQSLSAGFASDLVWVKNRSTANSHQLTDSVRGNTNALASDLTIAEYTGEISLTGSGFSVSGNANATNKSSESYVAWCWDESATPGFDIVTYTGNGTNRTIAHSLGVAPKMIIVKNRTTAGTSWAVYTEMTGAANYLRLNSTIASTAGSTFWNSTAPTSSVFSVGTDSDVNANTNNHVAYLWSEVAGFSKFGSYTGGGGTDGPFVFLGFRPRWIMFKATNLTNTDWMMFDTARSSSNVTNLRLDANSSGQEATSSTQDFDILSNGFKVRGTNNNFNNTGTTYIFAAFAESPQKYSLAR